MLAGLYKDVFKVLWNRAQIHMKMIWQPLLQFIEEEIIQLFNINECLDNPDNIDSDYDSDYSSDFDWLS